jgi:hypothetical protein
VGGRKLEYNQPIGQIEDKKLISLLHKLKKFFPSGVSYSDGFLKSLLSEVIKNTSS